jgi:hypothetical protein
VVIGLGLKRSAPDQHWVYVLEGCVHRYAWISNYEKTPPNKTSLIAEVTVPLNQRIDINRLIDENRRNYPRLNRVRSNRNSNEIEVSKAWYHKTAIPSTH